MNIELINRSSRRMPRRFIESWFVGLERAASQQLNTLLFRGKELTIVFVSPAESKRMNGRYRKKNKPTDVLSFAPINETYAQKIKRHKRAKSQRSKGWQGENQNLGELLVCPEVLVRQAREHNHKFQDELALMLTHGFLHLLGFDHERTSHEAKKMLALQTQLVANIGRGFL